MIKIVILSFDDNRKGDFTYAKPILDKYGFKATFFIICNETTNKGSMNWQESCNAKRWYGHTITYHEPPSSKSFISCCITI